MELLRQYRSRFYSSLQGYFTNPKESITSNVSGWKKRIRTTSLIGLTTLMTLSTNPYKSEFQLDPYLDERSIEDQRPDREDKFNDRIDPLPKRSLDIDPLGRAPMKRSE